METPWQPLIWVNNTVCPYKHGTLGTILNLSTSAWIAGTQSLNTFILQPSWTEVDKLNIVIEFPCLLGPTVCETIFMVWYG